MLVLVAFAIAFVPFALVATLLLVATRLERAREARVAHQTAVTDAIHRELGAVVAPVIEPRAWRRLRLRVAVPFDRPALVARVVALTQEALAGATQGHLEIVLVPQHERSRG